MSETQQVLTKRIEGLQKALSREQVLDRLVALLRRGARPDDPKEASE